MCRYDLLCLEGIAQSLRVFNGQEDIPTYKLANISKESMIKMHVKPEVIILRERTIVGAFYLMVILVSLQRLLFRL